MYLLGMELARFTLGYLCSCILEGCRPKETLSECFAGKCSCANVVTTYASMYLCQQLLSVFPVNTLQFHTVGPPYVQSVIDKLVQTGPPVYSFSFILVIGEFSSLEKVDYVPCPSWSLGHGNKD